jgi:hypothetical protein
MEKGQIFGLKSATGRVERVQERYAERIELTVTDCNDRVFKLQGRAMTTFPWQCWPNMVAFIVLCEWQMGDLRGYGEAQDFFEHPQLNELNSNEATRRPSRPL